MEENLLGGHVKLQTRLLDLSTAWQTFPNSQDNGNILEASKWKEPATAEMDLRGPTPQAAGEAGSWGNVCRPGGRCTLFLASHSPSRERRVRIQKPPPRRKAPGPHRAEASGKKETKGSSGGQSPYKLSSSGSVGGSRGASRHSASSKCTFAYIKQ